MMINCEWEIIQENPIRVKCINCGEIRKNPKLKRACNKQNKNIVSKTKRFIAEYTKWKINGGQYRSNEEIDRIYEICKSCEFFKPNKARKKYGECDICGCHLKDSNEKDMNKIAMSTTKCPYDPPKWEEEDGALERQAEFLEQERKKADQIVDQPQKKKGGCGCKKS